MKAITVAFTFAIMLVVFGALIGGLTPSSESKWMPIAHAAKGVTSNGPGTQLDSCVSPGALSPLPKQIAAC